MLHRLLSRLLPSRRIEARYRALCAAKLRHRCRSVIDADRQEADTRPEHVRQCLAMLALRSNATRSIAARIGGAA